MIEGIEVRIDGGGPRTLVMIHGWPDTAALWEPQVQAFQGEWRCVRFTLPGFDRAHPRRVYPIDEIVATLHKIVTAVSSGQTVTMLLHDWGCVFGYRFINAHPELVAALIALDVGDAGSREHLASLALSAKLAVAAYQLWLALAWHLPSGLGDWMTRRMAGWLRAPGSLASIGGHMNYPYHVQWTQGYRSRPFQPSAPMLFVFGQRKPFMFHSDSWARALATRPKCAVESLHCGHWVSRAPEFNSLALTWLRGLSAS
jgi:pimeloyl-ACP methyl ester carboxylesterase